MHHCAQRIIVSKQKQKKDELIVSKQMFLCQSLFQAQVESPHWTLKKTKTDSPNGSVNSGKLAGSGERRTKTATQAELHKLATSNTKIRDRAQSNLYLFSEGESPILDQFFIPENFFFLPFYQVLPDRFHSSRESLASMSILLLPTLLNDR